MTVTTVPSLPEAAFLQAYREARAYTDGFSIDLPFGVTLAGFIGAFYTTWLFKLERLVLATLVARPSSDAQAAALARGESTRFAAWTVEARDADQILLCDFLSKTRSWLKVTPTDTGTRLYFGSAIVPERILPDGRVDLGVAFHLLLPVHRLYSRALLRAAAQSLTRLQPSRYR